MTTQRLYTKVIRSLPDKVFVYLFYTKFTHRLLPLRNPKRFTEKLAWLKMFGNLERFGIYADKYTVREHIERQIGSEYLIPLLGVWDNVDEVPFDTLPKQFVLKVTHGCGYNLICPDKSKLDIADAKQKIDSWLHEDFYKQERESQYKLCTPRIVAEQYLEDETGSLRDYKFWCSKGKPMIVQVDTDRFIEHKSNLFSTDWELLDTAQAKTFEVGQNNIPRPKNLDKMLAIAAKLSADFPFVRVDLYNVNGKIYFGELTFTPGSGIVQFDSKAGDIELGRLIDVTAYARG